MDLYQYFNQQASYVMWQRPNIWLEAYEYAMAQMPSIDDVLGVEMGIEAMPGIERVPG